MAPIESGSDASCVEKLKEVIVKMTGLEYIKVIGTTISDGAALGVAAHFNHWKDLCQMHAGDKICRAAIGELTRSRNGQVLNPFPEGQALVKLVESIGKFLYYNRPAHLHVCWALANGARKGSCPEITVKHNLNKTRVAAMHKLFISIVRLYHGIEAFQFHHEPPWTLSGIDWESIVEVLAVFDVCAKLTTLVQTEKKMTAALSYFLKEDLLSSLRSSTFQVVDLPNVTASTVLPKKAKKVADFTPLGREVLRKAIVEAERRFCGNRGEEPTGAHVELEERDKLSMLLDPRTVLGTHVRHIPGLLKECFQALQKEYVRYSLGVSAYKAEKAAEKRAAKRKAADDAAAAAASATDADATAAVTEVVPPAEDVWDELLPPLPVTEIRVPDEAAVAQAQREREAEAEAAKVEAIEKEFVAAFRCFMERAKVPWSQINEEAQLGLELPTGRDIVPLDLFDVDMSKVMKHLYFDVPDRGKYGHLPMMAMFSRGSIAANSAVSFCERINSAANLVVTKGNSLLDSEDINMMTVLRTNREFMEHMRSKDSKASGQRFNMTLVDGAENVDDSSDSGSE
jgi:hypothetical protein